MKNIVGVVASLDELAQEMKKFTAIWLIFLCFLSTLVTHNEGATPRQKRCGNSACSVPISRAKTLLRYSSIKENGISFHKGVEVEVLSKLENDWVIKIGDKTGFAPSSFLKEVKLLIPSRNLVVVSEDVASEPVKVETTQKESAEVVMEKTKEIPGGLGSLLSFPSMAAAESVEAQGSVPTPSSPQFEVVDGTTLWMDPVLSVQDEPPAVPPTSINVEEATTVSQIDPSNSPLNSEPSAETFPGTVSETSSEAPTSYSEETVQSSAEVPVTPIPVEVTPPAFLGDYAPQEAPELSTEAPEELPTEAATEVPIETTTTAIPAEPEEIKESQDIEPTQPGLMSNIFNTLWSSGDGTEANSQEEESEADEEDEEDGEVGDEDDGEDGSTEEGSASATDTPPTESPSSSEQNTTATTNEEMLSNVVVENVPQTPPFQEDLASSFPQTQGDPLEERGRTVRQTDASGEEVTGAGLEMTSGEQSDLNVEEQEQHVKIEETTGSEIKPDQVENVEEVVTIEKKEESPEGQEEEKQVEEEKQTQEDLEHQQGDEMKHQQQENQGFQINAEEQKHQEELKLQQEEELKRQQEEELKYQQEEELKRQQKEEELKRQQEEELKRQQEEELKRQQEEELKRQQEEEVKRQQEEQLKRQQEEELRRSQEEENRIQEEEAKLRQQQEEEQKRLFEEETRKREEENRKAFEEEQELWRQNQEKQRVREEEMKREKIEAKKRQEALEREKEQAQLMEQAKQTPTEGKPNDDSEQKESSPEDEEVSGGMFTWFSGLFGGNADSENNEPEETVTIEPQEQTLPDPSLPANPPPLSHQHVHPPVWSSDQQTMCSASEAGCEMKIEPEEELQAGFLVLGIQAPSLDIILLRFAATAVALFMGALSFYFLRKKHVDSGLVARINELEKQLLIASKEAIILKEEALTVNADVNSEEIISLREEIESCRLVRADLEEQVVTLERELEEATETGIELNKLLSETLEASKGKAHAGLAASVERLQQQLDGQKDKVDSLTRSLKTTSAENENLKLLLAEGKERVSALEAELAAAGEIANNIRKEREEANVQTAQELQQVQAKLEEALSSKVLQESRMGSELSALKLKYETLRSSLSMKDAEVKVLQETLKQVESGHENAGQLLDVSKIKAELEHAKSERDSFNEKYQEEENVRKSIEDSLEKKNELLKKLEEKMMVAERNKEEAETRLAVLSNYFKEKEEQLQKELGLKEAILAQHQGDESTVVKHLQLLQEEVNTYKAQNESLKKEILDQERDFKGQIALLEKKAHDNWMTARQAERRLEDSRQEAAQLRNRLTFVEKNSADPNSRLDANGESGVASPVMMMPLPPLGDMESPTPYPPFMFSPPPPFMPPPFMPPPLQPHPMGRPPPLGRMSSPPPPLGQFSPPPPPYDRLDRSSRSPSPPPHRYHHRSPPPPEQWGAPPGGTSFRPVPKPSPKKPSEPRDQKGLVHSSGHSNESMDKSRENV